MSNWRFSAIGTEWVIDLFEITDGKRLKTLQQLVNKRIERFDKAYSRFRSDSLVTRIAERPGDYILPADGRVLLKFYRSLYDATDGAVTPLIGDMLVAAGYDAEYSFQSKQLQVPPRWDDVLVHEGTTLHVKRPVLLDFGAAGKGYLVDLIADLLKTEGVDQYCVDAGGDMLVHGDNPLRVGLEHPTDPQQVIGVIELDNRAVAGSAPNRRTWAGYHHIMDPFARRSSTGLKAAWVVADSALLADGLATALFFVSPERLDQFDFEYLLVNDENQYKHSSGFPAELF